MSAWVTWTIIALILLAGEAFTLGFILGPIGLAAGAGAVAAALGGSFELQVALFVVVATGSLVGLRPIARRHLDTPADIRTGAAALVGQRALVTARVTFDDPGAVKLAGQPWTARSANKDDVIEADEYVTIQEITGATALVVPAAAGSDGMESQ